jgi:hypothetical protein
VASVKGCRYTRADDIQIYERSIARIEGLARLLVLEKLKDSAARDVFQSTRRNLRDRPILLKLYSRRQRKHKGDLKAATAIGGLDMNDYDVTFLHVPYGPGWDVKRIDKLVYATVRPVPNHLACFTNFSSSGLGNELCVTFAKHEVLSDCRTATFNPKNKGRRLHRHPACFGTMTECLEDCCGVIPLDLLRELELIRLHFRIALKS